MVLPLAIPLVAEGVSLAFPLIAGGLLVAKDLLRSKRLGDDGFPAAIPLKGRPPAKPGTKPKTGVRRPRVLPAPTEPEPLAPSIPFPEPPPSNNNSPFIYPQPGQPGQRSPVPPNHTPEQYRDPTGRDVPPDWIPNPVPLVYGGRGGAYYRVVGNYGLAFADGRVVSLPVDSLVPYGFYLPGPIRGIRIHPEKANFDWNGSAGYYIITGGTNLEHWIGPFDGRMFFGWSPVNLGVRFIEQGKDTDDGVPFPGGPTKPGTGRPFPVSGPVTAPPPVVPETEPLPNPVIPSPFLPPGFEPYQPFPIPAYPPDPEEPEEEDPVPDEDVPFPSPIEEPETKPPSPDVPAPMPGTSNPGIAPSTDPFLPTVPGTPQKPEPAPKPAEPDPDPKPNPFPDPLPDIDPLPETKPNPKIEPDPTVPIPYPGPYPDTDPSVDPNQPDKSPFPDPIPTDNPTTDPYRHPGPVPDFDFDRYRDPLRDREFDKPYKGDPPGHGWPGGGTGTDTGERFKDRKDRFYVPDEIDFDLPPHFPTDGDGSGGIGDRPKIFVPGGSSNFPDPFDGAEPMLPDLFLPPPYLPSSQGSSDDPCEESDDKCQQSMSKKLDDIKKKQDKQKNCDLSEICALTCIQEIQDKLDELLNREPDDAQYQTAMLPIVKKLDDGGEEQLFTLQVKPGSLSEADKQKFANTAQYAIEGLYDPIHMIAIPEAQQMKLLSPTPHLVYMYREKTAQDKWSTNGNMATFSIPHYNGPRQKPSLLSLERGSIQGMLVLNDNSKVVVYAANSAEAKRVLNFARTFIPSDKLTNSVTKIAEISKELRTGNLQFYKASYFLGLGKRPEWSIWHTGAIRMGK